MSDVLIYIYLQRELFMGIRWVSNVSKQKDIDIYAIECKLIEKAKRAVDRAATP